MTPTPIRGFRIPNVLMERIDSGRGAQSRTGVVVRALELWLDARADDDAFDAQTQALRPRNAVPATKAVVTVSPSEDAARLKERLGLTTAVELARRVARPPDDFTKPPPIRRPLTSAEIKQRVKPL